MKAEITADGHIRIEAETMAEAYAIKYLMPANSDTCTECGQLISDVIMVDVNILTDSYVEVLEFRDTVKKKCKRNNPHYPKEEGCKKHED